MWVPSRQSGFGAPANLADWPRQGSNPGPTGFEAKRLSKPVSREPTPLISGLNARFNSIVQHNPKKTHMLLCCKYRAGGKPRPWMLKVGQLWQGLTPVD